MRAPEGRRAWVIFAAALAFAAFQAWQAAALARSPRSRAIVRERVTNAPFGELFPHSTAELAWFFGLSLSAGFCEELLYRGYFIQVLSPLFGWWGAAVVALPFFGLLHAYQGPGGVLRTTLVGAFMTLTVALTRSLVPAMLSHALVDVTSGLVVWMALRESPPGDEASTVALPPTPRAY